MLELARLIPTIFEAWTVFVHAGLAGYRASENNSTLGVKRARHAGALAGGHQAAGWAKQSERQLVWQ